ncbi:hypothetical protein LPJ75_001881 [Coemansia sp. RSA 2598]|nr:hypothetical protein LPJ75_001881 [Coemansia sp. RSA 2598]
MSIHREMISSEYQHLGNAAPIAPSSASTNSSTATKNAYPGIQESGAGYSSIGCTASDMSSPAALLPVIWTSASTASTCAMDTAGFAANLSPALSQASGFATPWPLATSAEPYPQQDLFFSYPQQTAAPSSIPLQSVAAAAATMPAAGPSTCSERPQSRADPSLVPMFSPFDPPMSLSPHLLSIQPVAGGLAASASAYASASASAMAVSISAPAAQMSDDMYMHVSKQRALGRSWQQISSELSSASYPGAAAIGDAAHLMQLFDAKLASINTDAAAATQSLPLSVPLSVPLSLTMQFPPQHYEPHMLTRTTMPKRHASRPESAARRSIPVPVSSAAASSRAMVRRGLVEEKEHQTYINIDQFFELQRLIRVHGEDWNKLGQLMNMRGSDLSACWNGYTVDSKVTREWTAGEMEILGLCRELGIPCRLSSKIIGSKLPLQCRRKILKKDRLGVHEIYEHLHPEKTPPSEPAPWSTGHVNVLHKTRLPASSSESDLVSRCVEEMVAAQPDRYPPSVDWSTVSARVGLSVQRCLELNRYSGSKASWVYSVETFEWDRAEHMRQYIVSNYPKPTPINFVAVSNYLWTDMTDCISMYGLLCGRFEWTQEVLTKIGQLVGMGWTDESIASYLSPVMTGTRIAHARLMFQAQEQAFASVYGKPQIPAEMDAAGLATIRHLVDMHAENRAVDIVGLLELIRASLPAHDRTLVDKCALITISNHATCVAKMIRRAHRKPKPKAKAKTKGNGKTKGKEKTSSAADNSAASSAFDDPAFYSAKWTESEIDMLVQYAKANGPERNWRHFADIIGTKTSSQCSNKYRSLRRYQKMKI